MQRTQIGNVEKQRLVSKVRDFNLKLSSNDKTFANNYFHELDEQVISSRNEQLEIESNDVMNFDEFLEDYFANDA